MASLSPHVASRDAWLRRAQSAGAIHHAVTTTQIEYHPERNSIVIVFKNTLIIVDVVNGLALIGDHVVEIYPGEYAITQPLLAACQ